MTSRLSLRALAVGALLLTSAAPALAAPCGTGPFETWLEDFKKEAAAKGISASAIQAGLSGVTLDKSVLARDQSQKVFSQSFEEFSGRMVPPRMTRGSNMLKQYGSVLGRIEQTYGVPGEVLVAIWGLETDFGVNIGKFPTLRALATLAYDCRRGDMFKAELMDALRIVERGDIAPQDLRGAWAGEIGQTQFMPSSYVKFAVDFDGNGRRDLLRSAPDVLASTANFLAYVKSGFYKDTIFHRVINGFMIQGGGYTADLKPKQPLRPTIKSEEKNGLSNLAYTISMARHDSPDSGQSQWFINVVDNIGLDYPNAKGHGYAVFGKVIQGKETVDKIKAVLVDDKPGFQNVPVNPIVIKSATVLKNRIVVPEAAPPVQPAPPVEPAQPSQPAPVQEPAPVPQQEPVK